MIGERKNSLPPCSANPFTGQNARGIHDVLSTRIVELQCDYRALTRLKRVCRNVDINKSASAVGSRGAQNRAAVTRQVHTGAKIVECE